MRKILLTISSALVISGLSAQINYGGEPITWSLTDIESEVSFISTDPIDIGLAKAQDEVTDQYKETPYRFGIEHVVDINFFDEASSHMLKGNREVWRLGIECRDALSVNFLFDQFYLPAGSQLFVYSEDREDLKGAFTEASNKESGVFPVGIVNGDRIIIEYIEPVSGEEATLHISQIVHAYRPVVNKWASEARGPYGNSGACNINVNCPEGLPWEAQKRSVALILSGGNAACSGAMVNNTLQDETPYFLTANHCLLDNPNTWVYVFNHETQGCTGNTGPTDQTISGGDLRASNGGSDFALVELSEYVPTSYNVYFSGWDNSDAQSVTSAIGIHHPLGDLKKICFENDAPYHNTTSGAAVWFIDQWEDGVTEPASSGSPLFDQNGRIIGQLFGGAAACSGSVNNGQFDYYGRLGVSWDGSSASNRLHDWLDPNGSGAVTLDGYGPNDVAYSVDVAGLGITDIPDVLCDIEEIWPTFTLRNAGTNTLTSATVEYSYNGTAQTPLGWTGSLEQGETSSITLASFSPVVGDNTIEVTVTSPNGGDDENDVNNSSFAFLAGVDSAEDNWTVSITTDNFGHETYWEIRAVDGATVISGGNPGVGIDGAGAETADEDDPGAYDSGTTYTETVSLPSNGCYEFIIVDDYADGICCGFGMGSYSVTDGGGTVIASGGQFGGTESEIRKVIATSMSEFGLSDAFNIFPNPASSLLNVSFAKELGSYRIDVINALGQTVLTESYNGDMNVTLDLDLLAGGSYILQVSNETSIGVQRFTLR